MNINTGENPIKEFRQFKFKTEFLRILNLNLSHNIGETLKIIIIFIVCEYNNGIIDIHCTLDLESK